MNTYNRETKTLHNLESKEGGGPSKSASMIEVHKFDERIEKGPLRLEEFNLADIESDRRHNKIREVQVIKKLHEKRHSKEFHTPTPESSLDPKNPLHSNRTVV